MATATATKKRSKGAIQKANSRRGKLQAPNLGAYYDEKKRPIEPGLFDFRVLLVRPEEPNLPGGRYLPLDRNNVSLEWIEGEGSTMTGTLTLRRPEPDAVAAVPVLRGHRIRLLLQWAGTWNVLWDMQVREPPPTDVGSGTLTLELADPLSALHLNEKQWEFRKDKQHPDGWTADQITRFVCSDQKVQIGTLASAKVKIKKLKLKGSGLEVIRRAWAQEKRKTGQRYLIRFRLGGLQVIPFGRPGVAYEIKGIEKSAETSATAPSLHPTTIIKAKGHLKGTAGKKKKIEETVQSNSAMARFGRSEKEVDYGKVDSQKELREEATRDLSEGLELERAASLTIPGIPFIEKGSQIIWRTNEPGWFGKVGKTKRDRAFAWATSVSNSLNPASYETTIVISQDDIYLADREQRDEERRDKSKKERDGRKAKAKGKSE